MLYKKSELSPVKLHHFRDDYGAGWTALNENYSSHILCGHNTKKEAIARIDESPNWRFDYLSVFAYKIGRKYKHCQVDSPDRYLDYGESIQFKSDRLIGWVARVEETHLTIFISCLDLWANHPLRKQARLFWRECSIAVPLPTTEAEYQELIDRIDSEIICS